MLTPEYLESLPEPVVTLWQQVEDDILRDIARRIGKMDGMTETADFQLWRLEEIRTLRKSVTKILARYSGKTENEIRNLLQAAGKIALDGDDAVYAAAGYKLGPLNDSAALLNLLNAGYAQTLGTWENLTATTANTVTQEFEHALDRAWLQVSSGAFDYKTAIKRAVDGLAQHMPGVTYPSGHHDTLEVAVRRAVLTGINQTASRLQLERMAEFDWQWVEVSAHSGARPEHAAWQGKLYHRGGTAVYQGKRYEDFEAATGYGTGEGLCGWNCRHTFFASSPDNPPAWSPEELAALSEKTINYNGEKYTKYEISQMQRSLERKVRSAKRKYMAETEAGVDATRAAVELKTRREALKQFIAETHRRMDSSRTSVSGFGHSAAAKASNGAERYYREWSQTTGVRATVKTLAQYYAIKYNDAERYELLKRYVKSVNAGFISPMAGFDVYESLYNRIESEVIGITTIDGRQIKSQSMHFMERVVGTIEDPQKKRPRSGVPIEDIIDCLKNGKPDMPRQDNSGRWSIRYKSEKACVSVNTDSDMLIQTNPR